MKRKAKRKAMAQEYVRIAESVKRKLKQPSREIKDAIVAWARKPQ